MIPAEEALKSEVFNEIYRKIGSSEFMVILNGLPMRSLGSYVYARAKKSDNSVELYTKYRSEGRPFYTVQPRLNQEVFSDLMSGNLFGYDFTTWMRSYEAQSGRKITVNVNNNLKLLILESGIYNIFKSVIPTRENLNVTFQPKLENGSNLTTAQLSDLLAKFRVNGFESLLALDAAGLSRRIFFRLPKFYKIQETFSLCLIWENHLYNPLLDDKMLRSTIEGTRLFKDINRRSMSQEGLGLSFSVLSLDHIRRGLGIDELVPMNFRVFTYLIAGLIMDPDTLPISYPSKKPVMRLAVVTDDDLPKVVDLREFAQMSDYARGFYARSSALNTFLLQNNGFFQSRGFRNIPRLTEIFNDAVLM